MPTVSSISPPVPEKRDPKFIFQEKSCVIDSYESFEKEGFAHLLESGGQDMGSFHVVVPYEREMDFLNKADLTRGPILVSLQSIIRSMAVD